MEFKINHPPPPFHVHAAASPGERLHVDVLQLLGSKVSDGTAPCLDLDEFHPGPFSGSPDNYGTFS